MLNFEPRKALVIAPHPDDEVFGCGGFVHRLKQAGNRVYVLYMTVGTAEDFSARGISTADERLKEVERVVEHLNIDGYSLAFPGDGFHLRLDSLPQKDLVHAIERQFEVSLQNLQPDIVLTPSTADYNQDHRAVAAATIAATRPGSPSHKSFQPLVLSYELPYHQHNTATSLPSPGFFVRLDEDALSRKISALKLYASQLKGADSPLSIRGVETLAAHRGITCGAAAAEAFQIVRMVV